MTPPLGAGSYALSLFATSALSGGAVPGQPGMSLVDAALVGAIVLAFTVGTVLVLSALAGSPRQRPIAIAGVTSLIVGVAVYVALPLVPAEAFALFGLPYLVGFALMGFGASACIGAWAELDPIDVEPRAEPQGGLVGLLILATLLPVALLTVGLLEAFIWGPEAQTEGLVAAEVWAALSSADAAAARTGIIAWAVIAALLSLLPLLVAALTRRMPEATPARRRSAIIISGLFAGGMVASLHWVGTFSLGMSIADTLPPYAGSLSVQGETLIVLGSVLLASALCATLVARPAPRPQPSDIPEATPAC